MRVAPSRGGTTATNGFLDDGHFYTSISRATTAGLLCGSYHYVRFDILTLAGLLLASPPVPAQDSRLPTTGFVPLQDVVGRIEPPPGRK